MLNTLSIEQSPFSEQEFRRLRSSLDGLSPAQAQWLGGYLAGRAAEAGLTPGAASDKPGSALKVIYASETGNGKAIAASLHARLCQQGVGAELIGTGDLRPGLLRKLESAVFIISTHGEGEPPEDAMELFEYLDGERAPALPGLNYRVLALGDRSYAKFCAAGRWLDERLRTLGARPFGPRIECDVDYSADAGKYTDEVLQYALDNLVTGHDEGRTANAAPAHLSLVPDTAGWGRERPVDAEIGRVQKITADASDKEVFHIEMSLEDPELRYQPGDSLGVWASNDPQLVEWILGALQIGPSEIVHYDGEDMTASTALADRLELTRLRAGTVTAYARVSARDDLAEFFSGLDADARQDFISRRQLADLVEAYPARVPAQALVEILRPLAPRSYSIASSQRAVDGEVHLTVATLRSNATGTGRQGVASSFLNQRLDAGDSVRVFLEPNPRFRLPADPQTQVIMIAAGTGIAPFRAFMQELESRDTRPDSWLIFGNPHLRTDFLYQREWLRWRETGLLGRIDTAWSRDGDTRRYVQDVVREQAARIDDWLKRGAVVYLCGSLEMGNAVLQTLGDALAAHRSVAPGQAAGIVKDLRRERRIRKDLY